MLRPCYFSTIACRIQNDELVKKVQNLQDDDGVLLFRIVVGHSTSWNVEQEDESLSTIRTNPLAALDVR